MKDKNRIEIIGAYYLRIRIGKFVFGSGDSYKLKSSAMRAAQFLSAQLVLPIYDYNEEGILSERDKFKII